MLCVLLAIGTVSGTVMAIKNSKDTVVDVQTGELRVANDVGREVVTVKARGTTFETFWSNENHEEEVVIDPATGEINDDDDASLCVMGLDVMNMWLANAAGTDARLVLHHDDREGSDEDNDVDDHDKDDVNDDDGRRRQ